MCIPSCGGGSLLSVGGCGRPVQGQCITADDGAKFHVACFVCGACVYVCVCACVCVNTYMSAGIIAAGVCSVLWCCARREEVRVAGWGALDGRVCVVVEYLANDGCLLRAAAAL